MKILKIPFLVLLALAASSRLPAQEPPPAPGSHPHRLGTVEFPNSGSPTAQAPFLRGVALLHSFEYPDAAGAFREAQAADPGFALAYWGEALTRTQLLWGVDDAEGARAVLSRLAPTAAERLARAGTPRERAYGAAVEAFFGEGEPAARSRAFADSLRALAVGAPDDLEAAAFASIGIQMAIAAGGYPAEERTAAREEAIRLAERVFASSPDHPGAAHYLIHAYDDPVLAPRGLEAARAYSSIAPDAEHALHMPSHIFVQVGLWADAARSNERAWAASREWVASRGSPATELDFHSLEWLQYAYLQQGRLGAAAALIDSAGAALAGVDPASGSLPDPVYVVPRMQFARAAASGDWTSVPPPDPVDTPPASARERSFRATDDYQRAAAAALRGDPAPAVAAAERFRAIGTSTRWTAFAAAQLEALAAAARGEDEAARAGLAAAARAEEAIAPVGPASYLPTHELLGASLLEAGRPAEAADAYRTALARRPNRSSALLGLARARAAQGDAAGAAEAYGRLLENWSGADPDLPGLAEARAAVATP